MMEVLLVASPDACFKLPTLSPHAAMVEESAMPHFAACQRPSLMIIRSAIAPGAIAMVTSDDALKKEMNKA